MKLDKDRRRGLVGTIIVHAALLVFLLFVALRTPLPLPGEEGVEVNLGFDNQGMGNIQSEEAPPKEEPQPQPQKVTPPPPVEQEPEPEPVEEDIITQDTEEAPAIEEKEEQEPEKEPEEKPEENVKEEPVEEEVVEEEPEEEVVDSIPIQVDPVEEEIVVEDPKPVVNKRALYTGSTSDGQGTNQGVTEGGGDQGKPHGYKESDKYDGKGGSGDGVSFFLGGRGSLHLERPSAKFTEQGRVIVDIWVDKAGIVKRAQVNAKGTNIIDPNLKQIAIDAAYNSKFAQDPNADNLQRGTITYNFILMK